MKSVFRQCPSGRLGSGGAFIQTGIKEGKRNVAILFFEPGGILKRWNGTEWVKSKLKVNTASFEEKPLLVYKAGAFIGVDSSGL